MIEGSLPRLALFGLPLLLMACGDAAEQGAVPVQDQSLSDEASTPEPSPTPSQSDGQSFAKSMPAEMLGDWHKDDLGHAPTAEDCDPRLRGTIDWDRLMTVREGGYSYFETGGRIIEVHGRTDTTIDATFDTTYADDPTSERRDFALLPGGTLVVNADGGNGVRDIIRYRRCPE